MGHTQFQGGVVRGLASWAATHWDTCGMAATDWHPVTSPAGVVLGWMAAPDPGERPDGTYWDDAPTPWLDLRAEVLVLMGDECFDLDDVWESARSAGLTDDDLDSLGYLALELQRIEYRLG